jgi:hypothetical protein
MPTSGIYFPTQYTEADVTNIRQRLARLADQLGLDGSVGELLASIAFGDFEVRKRKAIPPIRPSPRPDFIRALADALGADPDTTRQALTSAAAQVVEAIPDDLRLYRRIEPHNWQVSIVLEADDADPLILDAADVAVLRALICALDETAPPQPGEPLSTAMRLSDGRITSVYELDYNKLDPSDEEVSENLEFKKSWLWEDDRSKNKIEDQNQD